MVISPRNSRLGLAALVKRFGMMTTPDSPDGELIKYKVRGFWLTVEYFFSWFLFINLLLLTFSFLFQWDDPNVIPADMTVEVSELFTRELSRVHHSSLQFLKIRKIILC